MKKLFCIIVVLMICSNLLSQNISSLISDALERHIEMENDGINEVSKKIYVTPYLFQINKNILPKKTGNTKINWLISKRQILEFMKKREREKCKEDYYRNAYTINMDLENNNVVIYVQFRRPLGGIDGADSRIEYKYDTILNEYIFKKITYNKFREEDRIGLLKQNSIYNELFQKHFSLLQTKNKYNDTIDVIYYHDKFPFIYNPDIPQSVFNIPISIIDYFNFDYGYKMRYNKKYVLSIDMSFNEKGNILIYFRDIYCVGDMEYDYEKIFYPNRMLREESYSKFELKYNSVKQSYDIISHTFF